MVITNGRTFGCAFFSFHNPLPGLTMEPLPVECGWDGLRAVGRETGIYDLPVGLAFFEARSAAQRFLAASEIRFLAAADRRLRLRGLCSAVANLLAPILFNIAITSRSFFSSRSNSRIAASTPEGSGMSPPVRIITTLKC